MANLTKTELLRLNVKAEQVWTQNALKNSMGVQTEAVKAVLANQTAKFKEFDDHRKDRVMGIAFIDPCGALVRDCSAGACDITEDELSTDLIEYEPNICKEIGFSINEDKLRKNMFNLEDIYAEGISSRLNAMDEYLSTHVLAGLKAGAGVNLSPDPYTWNNAQKTTNVDQWSYTLDLIPDMVNDSMLNKMGSVYFIDNGSLWKDFFKAQINVGNGEGKGDKAMTDVVKMYFDQFNFGKAGLSESTFMISNSAVALKTTNKFAPSIVELAGKVGQTRYRLKSPNLEGIEYDVVYQLTCNAEGEIVHTWRIYLRGFFATNPKGCPISTLIGGVPTLVQSTGILSYTKTA